MLSVDKYIAVTDGIADGKQVHCKELFMQQLPRTKEN
jgi:hypothetical protein